MKRYLPLFMVLISFHPTFIKTMLYTQKSSKSKKSTPERSFQSRKPACCREAGKPAFLPWKAIPLKIWRMSGRLNTGSSRGYPKEVL